LHFIKGGNFLMDKSLLTAEEQTISLGKSPKCIKA